MTSAEVWPEGLELDPNESENPEDRRSGPVRPWSNQREHRRPPLGVIPPDHSSPQTLRQEPGPGAADVVEPGGANVHPVNDIARHGPLVQAGADAHAASSEMVAPRPERVSAEPGLVRGELPRGGPERIDGGSPATVTSGPTAADLLPLMASALNDSNPVRNGSIPVAGGSDPTPVADTGIEKLADIDDGGFRPVGLPPDQARALQTLHDMADLYGTGDRTTPEVRKLPRPSGEIPGQGDTVTAANGLRSRQRDTADVFEDRDHRLDAILNGHAGRNVTEKKAMNGVLQNVGSSLGASPPPYRSTQEKQQMDRLFDIALEDGAGIVSGGQRNADGVAAAINELAEEFEQDKKGEKDESSGGAPASKRPTGKASTKKAKAIKKAVDKAIKAAKAQLGEPYRFGGTGPDSWDCSGLVQYALKKAGVKVGRTTWQQYNQLRKVNGKPKAGDLVFNSSRGHVLMCIGNNKFIHAPRTGDVVRVVTMKNLERDLPGYKVARWTHKVPVNG